MSFEPRRDRFDQDSGGDTGESNPDNATTGGPGVIEAPEGGFDLGTDDDDGTGGGGGGAAGAADQAAGTVGGTDDTGDGGGNGGGQDFGQRGRGGGLDRVQQEAEQQRQAQPEPDRGQQGRGGGLDAVEQQTGQSGGGGSGGGDGGTSTADLRREFRQVEQQVRQQQDTQEATDSGQQSGGGPVPGLGGPGPGGGASGQPVPGPGGPSAGAQDTNGQQDTTRETVPRAGTGGAMRGGGTGATVDDVANAADLVGDVVTEGGANDRVTSTELFRQTGADAVVDTAFQPGTTRQIEETLGIPQSQRGDDVAISGPGVTLPGGGSVLESGESGQINQDVIESLTEGQGALSPQQEQNLREDIRKRQEVFGVGKEAEQFVTSVTGSEAAGEFARPFGEATGAAAGAPASLALTGEMAIQTAANLPETVREEGAADTARTLLETGGRVAEGGAESAAENPARFAGQVATAVTGGLAAGKAIQRIPDLARNARIRASGGEIVNFEDVSDPPTQTEGMGLPGFTQEAQADPDVAREEFVEQARETDIAGDDPVAFHGRSPEAVREFGGFGRSFEAPEGASELPGLFQSADLSPLRVQGGGSGVSLPRFGLPRPNVRPSRILAERDVDVDVAEGQGLTGQSRFLRERASREKSFIRTDTTPEQEVVAPPESAFTSEGVFGVRVGGIEIPGTDRTIGGQIVPGRLSRRVETDDVETDAETRTRAELAEETTRAITESRRRQAQEPDVPITPFGTGSTPPSGPTGVSDPFGGTFGGIETGMEIPDTDRRRGASDAPESGRTTPRGERRGDTTPPGSSGPTSASDVFGPGVTGIRSPTAPSDGTGTPTTPTETETTGGPTEPTSPTTGGSTTPSEPLIPGTPTTGPPTTGPPTEPPITPPTTPPTSPPTSPPSGPPGGPPTTGPPLLPPFTPPTEPPTRPPRQRDDETDRDEDEEPEILPQGQRFRNPVASGSQFLFGPALGDSFGGESVAGSILPERGEPLTEMGQRAAAGELDPFDFDPLR